MPTIEEFKSAASTAASNQKPRVYMYLSIVAYIVVAICASSAASDEELDTQDKHNQCPSNKGVQMYRAAMALAIIVIAYHFCRLILHDNGLGLGRKAMATTNGVFVTSSFQKFQKIMSEGLVPMMVASIAVLTTVGVV